MQHAGCRDSVQGGNAEAEHAKCIYREVSTTLMYESFKLAYDD